MAVVRPEFRHDVLTFPCADPVFGGPACRVATCERPARNRGLCWAHHNRWYEHGQPDLDEFVATTKPRWRRQEMLPCCCVDDCGYGMLAHQLCQKHLDMWNQAGRPELETWRPAMRSAPPPPACAVSWCPLWVYVGSSFCFRHRRTWLAAGQPEVAEYAASFDTDRTPRTEQIDLRPLGRQLRLEVQYALQCRRDDGTARVLPLVVTRLVKMLVKTEVGSLLEWSESAWTQQLPPSRSRAMLLYAHRRLDDLIADDGWASEYDRDHWRLRKLGVPGNSVLHFDQITQPWLKKLAKRWVRWRLSAGLGLGTVRTGLAAVTRFSVFLQSQTPPISELAAVDRAVLERYLADLHAQWSGRHSHDTHIEQLGLFLRAIRQHHWDSSLPTTAVFFPEDRPRRGQLLPRALAEHVLAQMEQPDNLARWDNPAYRLITVILIRCGLRVSDAARLPFECVVNDADNAPYLRYYNHKMKREALVPIDSELNDLIRAHQQHVLQTWDAAPPVLFPSARTNLNGTQSVRSHGYRSALRRWMLRCDIRDEYGRPVSITPHQLRHSLGTRLINQDVPQEVVRRILDHDSHAMTAHYARLSDTTIRRHWEKSRKVNATGEAVTLDPDGPLAEAAWAKQRISRATQALPNGYCSLPLVKTCPHANACLTCPMFVTTAEFLPQHRQQHQQVLEIISAAEARGQTRQVEMNQHVADNLEKIITALEADDPDQEAADAS